MSAQDQFVWHLTASQNRLYAFILALTGNPTDADDILQNTNLVLWHKAAEFTLGTDFLAWAFQIAHFQVRAARRDKGRDRHLFDEALVHQLATAAEADVAQFGDRQQALRACLRELPERQRALLKMRYETLDGVRQQIASGAETRGSIASALYRIRKALHVCVRKRLAQEQP